MKVWVIGRGYPTEKNQMLGSFELEQAQMLAKHGYDVYFIVISVLSIRNWNCPRYTESTIEGVTILSLNIPLGRFMPSYIHRQFYPIRKHLLNLAKKKYGLPDIIHVHYPAIYPYKTFEELHHEGVKLVCTEHWTKVLNKTIKKRYLKNLIDCVNYYDSIICVGESLAKSIKEITQTSRHIYVIPNIVPAAFSYKINNNQNNKVFRFVGVGRLVACKRFDLQIKAFAAEFKGNPLFKLDIIGGGEESESLIRLIRECGCDDQITLLGTMDRKKIAEYYHKCNALIMSSNLETFGVPIIEAMASGLPVITTDAMGFPSLFRKENGYIIPKDSEEALANAMRTLFDNYSRFDGEKISEYARAHFGEDTVFDMLNDVYTDKTDTYHTQLEKSN